MTRGEKNKQSNNDDDSSSRTELKYWLLKNKLDFGRTIEWKLTVNIRTMARWHIDRSSNIANHINCKWDICRISARVGLNSSVGLLRLQTLTQYITGRSRGCSSRMSHSCGTACSCSAETVCSTTARLIGLSVSWVYQARHWRIWKWRVVLLDTCFFFCGCSFIWL